MKKLFPALFLLLANLVLVVATAAAQDKPEMADVMRSNGKIYVVVVVCLLILFGLIGYVFRIDRKLSKLEKQSKD
ncbi:MAG: CcmD family protein [Chitinophagaceae bacterium]|nr:CcmD family protein [Chitinophagaceae bacterium]